MCPTNNHRLMPSRGRLIKSPEFRIFDQKIELWRLRNRYFLDDSKAEVERWLKAGNCLEVELDFCFPRSKLVSKKNEPKKIDVDGRIKSTLDAIFHLIGCDDKWAMMITAKKICHQSLDEFVEASIKPILWSKVKTIRDQRDGPRA